MKAPSLATAPVPFLDLGIQHRDLKEPLLADIADLVDSGAFTNGPSVQEFEGAFARYCGRRHCVGLASGLDALRLGLQAASVGRGDEVIVPAHTFVATFEAVTQAGATPVPVDVREDDYGLDVDAVSSVLNAATRAILPVHLYGQMADMRGVLALAAQHDLLVVEDACQAHGAERDGVHAGGAGQLAAFSFYPGKNLGAMGDAGALVTDDPDVAASVRALREHGQRSKYHHETEGWTARLDTIQALVLLRKLPRLAEWNTQRRAAAAYYGRELAGIGDLGLPTVVDGSMPVWHLYVVRTADPAALGAHLAARGVATGRHYPSPPHLMPAYDRLGYAAGAFPVTEALCESVLSLPLFPGITEEQQARVVEAAADFFGA